MLLDPHLESMFWHLDMVSKCREFMVLRLPIQDGSSISYFENCKGKWQHYFCATLNGSTCLQYHIIYIIKLSIIHTDNGFLWHMIAEASATHNVNAIRFSPSPSSCSLCLLLLFASDMAAKIFCCPNGKGLSGVFW